MPPFWGGSWVASKAYLPTNWYLDTFSHLATTDMGRKLGGLCPFGDDELDPHLTMWPGPRPTCMPSVILIQPTVWPQYTNVTDRTDTQTDRTDNGLIAWGEPFL